MNHKLNMTMPGKDSNGIVLFLLRFCENLIYAHLRRSAFVGHLLQGRSRRRQSVPHERYVKARTNRIWCEPVKTRSVISGQTV